ncbi:uncharacterized protein C8R40DRAFT_1174739 [Lentinula edodes]|uniref:uncharacterized protein n=1 Tax=Lentinula edodes TaxID=5353 RepID=UPI001E8EDE59|nr:uncharacterized protein C8R40DRAFT_1174739 [Lentinula edodes]KAH7871317.1 hypothetical protein C8R40DRAFT_1174739 [Lentinula edodes]
MPAVRGTSVFHTNVEAPFICSQCGIRTFRKADLQRHEKIHTGVRHQCPHEGCKFSASQRSNLNTHLALHDPSRRRACPDCAFCCKDPSSLIRHRKSQHSYVPKKYTVAEQPLKFLPPEGPSPNDLTTTPSVDLPHTNRPKAGRASEVANQPHPSILYQTPTRLAPSPGAKDVVDIAAAPAASPYLPSKDYGQTPLSALPFPFAEYPCAADFPPNLSQLTLLGPWQGFYSENSHLPHPNSQYSKSFSGADTGNDIAAGSGFGMASQIDFGVGLEMGMQTTNNFSVGMAMNANRRLTPAPPLVPALSMRPTYGRTSSYGVHQAPARRSNIWKVGQDYNETPGAGPSTHASLQYC